MWYVMISQRNAQQQLQLLPQAEGRGSRTVGSALAISHEFNKVLPNQLFETEAVCSVSVCGSRS